MESILDAVGNTPLVRLRKVPGLREDVKLYAKLEAFNPLGSVKDRLALGVLAWAAHTGALKPGQTVVEASSGNTGIGLAMVCAEKGHPFVCVMAESFSVERRKLMRFLGARVVLTPAHLKGTGMVRKAEELAEAHGWFLASQFTAEANAWIHEVSTGPEILAQLAPRKPDYVVVGVGTGGTLTGVGRFMRDAAPNCQMVALEPDNAPIFSAAERTPYDAQGRHVAPHPLWRPHLLQGWAADFIPKIAQEAFDEKTCKQVVPVAGDKALEMAAALAAREGILTGTSGGGAVAGALEVARSAPPGSVIVAVLADTGERYLSTPLFEHIGEDMSEAEKEVSRSTPNYRFDVAQAPPQAPSVPTTPEAEAYVATRCTPQSGLVMFSLEYCEFCWTAKKLFDAMGAQYDVVAVDAAVHAEGNFGGALRTALTARTGGKTFPQVVLAGEFLGGSTDALDLFKKGELQAKLKAAKVPFDEGYTNDNPYGFLPKWLHARG